MQRLRAHKVELLAALSEADQTRKAARESWAVVLRGSRLGEPVVFASDQEVAAWPEVQALALPVFDRAELAMLAAGAKLEDWAAAVTVKKQLPGSRVVNFEAKAGLHYGSRR